MHSTVDPEKVWHGLVSTYQAFHVNSSRHKAFALTVSSAYAPDVCDLSKGNSDDGAVAWRMHWQQESACRDAVVNMSSCRAYSSMLSGL